MKTLTVKETAKCLKCSERTIYRLISEAQLPAFRVRGSLRMKPESVEAYIEKQILLFQEETGFTLSDLTMTDND